MDMFFQGDNSMPTSFSSDILPLFRPTDIACMKARGVSLGVSDWMRDPTAKFGFPDHGNARRVFSALSRGKMPPDGAWPPDKLAIYQQWMNEGSISRAIPARVLRAFACGIA
ncbi:hypothetical protein QA648_35625 (plasmid) [Rhizobium sp. CB3171]|uniref:hypothetical protein n=1 Tax=Rhizobium sp. CB3171 TaxID=3039157 RepID=UPI0024B27596|nr:hypothetical protein [Rhizobium sp. CB3171]WFU07382.1 hypothetical protein QA648_35625 [Rhizobium sp. CB3171]